MLVRGVLLQHVNSHLLPACVTPVCDGTAAVVALARVRPHVCTHAGRWQGGVWHCVASPHAARAVCSVGALAPDEPVVRQGLVGGTRRAYAEPAPAGNAPNRMNTN